MAGSDTVHEIALRVGVSGKVEAADVLAVRRAVYGGDCLVSRAEAEAVYAVERARRGHCREWSEFFVEALTDFVLNQELPVGYLSAENAAWLEGQIKLRKEPSMDGDMAIVANMIERASEVPASFAAFALRLAKEAVIYGDGADAKGRVHASGRVDEADVAMLKRILWGAGSEGLLAVSRDEAEALFAIADATTGAANVPEFDDLFGKAIGNYLLGATGRAVPSRETALRWQTPAQYKVDVVQSLSQILRERGKINPKFLKDTQATSLAQEVEDEHARLNVKRDVEIEVAAIMTPEKASWLTDRIEKNGLMNGPEKALVKFIEREASNLGVDLTGVFAKVA